MLVSWNWLTEYLKLDMPVEALTERLMMAGLNLESVSDVAGDLCIDLEVTSNRPDCLGHIGVAREAAVLFHKDLHVPAAQPAELGGKAAEATSVEVRCPELCPQYVARLVRGVTIGPSPDWMQRRLQTVGIRPINNVVDVTNYVLMECGQPLHAFDFDRLRGGRIIVRQARAGERLTAIDQREYALQPEMCVIADADRPVAIAGIMGGLDTEIGLHTRQVLIEVAEFTPAAIRATARRLGLHSDSSYRFERGIDRQNLDWASRRCADLILQVAGGELCVGAVWGGEPPPPDRAPIVLRFSQIERVLGISVPHNAVVSILEALGLRQAAPPGEHLCQFIAPAWRRDLTREIDLIEEVARIHGYDKIPENEPIPLEVSSVPTADRVRERATRVLRAAGIFEAVTLSLVGSELAGLFQPWTTAPALRVDHASWKSDDILRQSLVPSLLQARRYNERHGSFNVALYETARVFLAARPGNPEAEPAMLAFVGGRPLAGMRGLIEAIVNEVNHDAQVSLRPTEFPGAAEGRAAEVWLDDRRLGWIAEVAQSVRDRLDLQDAATAVELDMEVLEAAANLSPRFRPLPQYPAVERDLNFVLSEETSWDALAATVRTAAGPLLEDLQFDSQYRGPQIPADKKSYVMRLHYRSADRTLTAEEIEAAQRQVIAACQAQLGAVQR